MMTPEPTAGKRSSETKLTRGKEEAGADALKSGYIDAKDAEKMVGRGNVPKKNFANRFVQDVDRVGTILKENESNQKGRKTKPKEATVPVINTMMIKKMIEDDGKLYLLSTMVQRVYGLSGGDNDKSTIEEEETPFAYRFNDRTPDDGQLELRRYEYHSIPMKNRTENISVSRFTFNGIVPLSVVAEFDRFPFTIFRAEILVELSTRNDTLGKNLRLKPNLLLHDERRNNISIQAPAEFAAKDRPTEGGDKIRSMIKDGMPESFISEMTLNKLDGSDSYSMISPYPEVNYEYDAKKDYCPRFRIAFYLNEDAIPKFIRIQLPMLLVAAINTFNYMISYEAYNSDNEDFVESSDRYLQTSAALGLTAVFVLPEMANRHNVSQTVTWNEMNVLLIFFSLAISSIPPTFVRQEISLGGVILLWASFIIPFYNLALYYLSCDRIRKNRIQSVNDCLNHPFVQTPSFKKMKESEDMLEKLVYIQKNETNFGRKSYLYLLQNGDNNRRASERSSISNY